MKVIKKVLAYLQKLQKGREVPDVIKEARAREQTRRELINKMRRR